MEKMERRSNLRMMATVPVSVRSQPGAVEVTAQTRDVSTNGVFLYTKSRMVEGAEVELVMILPPELTSGEKCWVCCQARIVRVENGPDGKFGVAAEIQRMDVMPEISA